MSDQPMTPDWWQASDGKFYPPKQHPNYSPPRVGPTDQPAQPPTDPATGMPTEPPHATPQFGPTDQPLGPDWWQASDGKFYSPAQHPNAQPHGLSGQPGQYAQQSAGYDQYGQSRVSAGESLSWGWKNVGTYLVPLLVLVVLSFIAGIVINVISAMVTGGGSVDIATTYDPATGVTTTNSSSMSGTMLLISLGFSVLSLVITSIFQMGMIRTSLGAVRGMTVPLGEALSTDRVGRFIGANLLIGLLTTVGLFLCIIPGLVFFFLTFLTGWFIVDKNLSVGEAMRESIRVVRNNAGASFVMALGVIGLVLLGLILCGIGILFTLPVAMLGLGHFYMSLNGKAAHA